MESKNKQERVHVYELSGLVFNTVFGGTCVGNQAFATRQRRGNFAEFGSATGGTTDQAGALLKVIDPER